MQEKLRRIEELEEEFRISNETYEGKISDLYRQLKIKDQSIAEAW